jgi:calcineurin-like phosphoesterase family protein
VRRTPAFVALLAFALFAFDAGASEPIRPRALRDRVERETAPATTRYVIAAAGDIACDHDPNGPSHPSTCQYDDTARLIDGDDLAAVLLLGDNQYERGRYRAYLRYFDPTWGRAFAKLAPAPGNHEYDNDPSSTPTGYFRYFGEAAKGPDGLGYYAFDVGACPNAPCWHVISLNSELCFAAGGCGPAADPSDPGPGNRMYAWLEQDLAAHADAEYPCTLAYWHHPRFSFSTGSGASTAVGPLWQLLHAASADVVLNGHSHNYQRWRPLDPDGMPDKGSGIREFVVGTGGASHYAIPSGARPKALAAAQANAFGVLRLTLKAEGYRWRWVSARGQPAFGDASDGVVSCVRASP